MTKFTINVSRHKGKHVEVTTYKKTATGMEIKITHNGRKAASMGPNH